MFELYDLVNDLSNMFKETESYRSFPVDVLENEDGYEVIAEMPGIKKENITISFDGGELSITATKDKINKDSKFLLRERPLINLKRTLNFGDIKDESMNAKLEDGILTITIKVLKEEEPKAKTIVIE